LGQSGLWELLDMTARLQHQAWVVAVSLMVFFVNLGGSRLWDDDETKNATCAREMFQRGDWVVPTFNSELRTDKPPLVCWLMIGAYQLFGISEFAARLPSALFAVGTTLVTYHLGRLLLSQKAGLWAAMILATSPMFVWAGRSATPDSALIFCTTAAVLVYVRSVGSGQEGRFLTDWKAIRSREFSAAMPRSTMATIGVYSFLSLAALAKGPVGVLLPSATIGLFLLAVSATSTRYPLLPERSTLATMSIFYLRVALARLSGMLFRFPRVLRAMRPFLLVTTVLVVALPWYLLVTLQTNGAWPRGFFFTHNLERFLQPIGGHSGTPLFHFLAIAIGVFPWTFVLLAGIRQLVRRLRTDDPRAPAYLFLASWIIVWLAFFSLCETKLPNYLLPAYPALAIICGGLAADWVATPAARTIRHWLSLQWISLALVGAFLCGGLALVLPQQMPEAAGFAWIGLIPLVGAACGKVLQRRGSTAGALGSLVATTVLLIVVGYVVVGPAASERQNGAQVADAIRRLNLTPDRIGAYRVTDAGLLFYTDIRHDDWNQCDAIAQSLFLSCDRPLLITDEEGYRSIRSLLPADAAVLSRRPRMFRHGEIVLIGRGRPDGLSAALRSAADKTEIYR
jgi:4-amino-4-deoxy-L-arabinose transferase-like glycosyltransferase